jgi:hypothetical protein
VGATPSNHPDRAGYLSNLGSILSSKFKYTKDLDDLYRATLWAKQALDAFPLDHPSRASTMRNLGNVLWLSYKHAKDLHDRDRAIQLYRQCVTFHSAPPKDRIDAAIRAASIVEEDENWADASEIREIAVNLLPHVSSRSLGQMDQQHMIKKYAGRASRAAAVALQANDSTSPAMDQSRPEPSSQVQVQSKKFLDWDRTDPRC